MRLLPLLLASLAALAALAAGAEPAPAAFKFDGDAYHLVDSQKDPQRFAEVYLRADETLKRYSRRITIADLPGMDDAKKQAQGVFEIAKQRTPGLTPDTYAAEGDEDRDVIVTWFDLTDDRSAVDYHAARFVALGAGKGVREYHFVFRRYTNGEPGDQTLAAVHPIAVYAEKRWLEELARFDRAPAR